jgi:hypothetical protein
MPKRNFITDNSGDAYRNAGSQPPNGLDDVLDLNGSVLMNGLPCKIARGQLLTASAADTVVTGLSRVVAVVASLDSDPLLDPALVSASIGDQVAAPVAGSVLIKTWKFTSNANPTPVAATTFGKRINWIAVGL